MSSLAMLGSCDDRGRLGLLATLGGLPEQARQRSYAPVQAGTLRLAVAVALAVPADRALPRVAVGEDGCVLMDWSDSLALTLEGDLVRMTPATGSASSLSWDGMRVPEPVFGHVPTA